MENSQVKINLTNIFRKVFSENTIIICDELTSKDVDGWDSLTHMLLIDEIETFFSIKFKLKELNQMKNVGEMIDIIINKIN